MGGKKTQKKIPIVDLGKLGLHTEPGPADEDWARVGKEITDAFRDIGFVYLKGHGVPEEHVEKLVSAGAKFFDLPQAEKDKFPRDPQKQQGYVAMNREKFDGVNSYEVREAYDVKRPDGILPDDIIPEFRPASTDFINTCKKLTERILIAMALGLGLDRNFFTNTHQEICSDNNASCLRCLHYPKVTQDTPAGAIRCGTHTDYGTITFLYQDDIGGLYVRHRDGQWISADPIEGTILVNVGDILQFWTSGKLVATEHKVLIPEEEVRQRKCRRSTVFFIHPDDPVLIQPIDDTSTFTPITAKEHVEKRFQQTYQY